MKVIAKNKRAYHDFEIKETFIAGIKLKGHEVKSVKTGHIKLQGAYVTYYDNALFLANAHIPPYEHASKASLVDYDPTRFRKLLLTRKQINYIVAQKKEKKLQVIPLKVYLHNNLIKVEIALAKPLKKYDKRRRRKEREEKLKVQRTRKTVEVRY